MKAKIVFPSLPSGHSVFCDDIRQEVAGKRSFIGVYNNELILPHIPSVVARLCIATTYREELDSNDVVVIKILFEPDGDPGEDEMDHIPTKFDTGSTLVEANLDALAQMAEPKPKGFIMKEARVDFQLSPLQVTAPGKLKVRAYRKNTEIRLGTLRIREAVQDSDDSPKNE